MKTLDFKNLIREPYAWPGGYPKYAIMSDGAALCKSCAKDNAKLIIRDTRDNSNSGWCFAGVDINWEDTDLYCDHCSNKIESAYGEDTE